MHELRQLLLSTLRERIDHGAPEWERVDAELALACDSCSQLARLAGDWCHRQQQQTSRRRTSIPLGELTPKLSQGYQLLNQADLEEALTLASQMGLQESELEVVLCDGFEAAATVRGVKGPS